MRVLLIDRQWNATNHQRGIIEGMHAHLDLTFLGFEAGDWPTSLEQLPDPHSFDVIIWRSGYKWLVGDRPWDWGGYQGLKVFFGTDAVQSYSPIVGRKKLGTWPAGVHRRGFDLVITTGREVRDRLIADGVEAAWIPKGYDGDRIVARPDPHRGLICHYGTAYAARRRALESMRRAGIPVEGFRCTQPELAEHLGRYLACLVCNMHFATPLPNRLLSRLPVAIPIERVGMEPMIKNFEVAGAGCAPVCDAIPELYELGFRDGVNMVSYRRFSELVEKMRHYRQNPDELEHIGAAAAELARTRHTWHHRGAQWREVLERYVTL
ncbi:MAG: glycosyltransferase family 1 protein [Alphaproteobacteria bacterium]|nr:glycosyltransferase family 1 protein [Alphaproteobacteria bacterium]